MTYLSKLQLAKVGSFFETQCSATSNNMKLVHWPLMGGLLHLAQRGGDWADRQLVAVPNVTAHTSTTVLPLLCGFNVPIMSNAALVFTWT